MNANRIPGVPSDPNRSAADSRQVQREAAQRIEKVGEVDPDEQARQQRFKQIMSESDSDDDEALPLPSPFDLSAAKQSDSSQDFGMDEIPSSSYSQPPTLSPDSQDTMSDEGLPESGKFWQKTDLPDQPIGKPRFQERTNQKQGAASKKTKEELSILGPPGKSSTIKSEPASKKKKTEEAGPQARYWEPDATTESRTGSEGKKRTKESSYSMNEKLGTDEPEEPHAPKTPFEAATRTKKGHQGGQQHKDDESKKKESLQIIPPSLPELPASIQPAAVAATQAVQAYLRPEAAPLFYQMVGSIMIMSNPPGISRTEFVLNNPAFSNSKFFGATVELIKFSTAPDSFNIRLTGSNEAVAAFNQSIPSLTAAFHAGHFAFRIGRIDAEYSTDRTPLIRRKEWDGEDSGEQSKQDKGR